MREHVVQMQLTDLSNKLNMLGNAVLNLRANYAILVKALEIAGTLTPEKFQAAVNFLAKASDSEIPADPAEAMEKEAAKASDGEAK